MKTPLKRFPPLLAFFIICCFAAVLLWLGLRLYFNQTRLEAQLTQTFTGAQLQVFAGEAKTAHHDLVVESTSPQGHSLIRLSDLVIDTRFYERLVIQFSEKHPNQPLTISVAHQQSKQPTAQPILYTNNNISQFELATLAPANSVINEIALRTHALIEPYRLTRLRFELRPMTHTIFAQLLWDSFISDAESLSLTKPQQVPNVTLLSAKMLVLLYFAVVGVLFALFLGLAGRSLASAWWVALLGAWAVLDIRALVEKTQQVLITAEPTQTPNSGLVSDMALGAVLFGLLSAWLLGFALVRGLLKQRYGYRIFAVGAGYVVGLSVAVLVLWMYGILQRSIVGYEVLAVLWLAALVIFLFFPAKRCSIEELRLEKAPSNSSYLLALLMVLLFLYRWGLTGAELLTASEGLQALPNDVSQTPLSVLSSWLPKAWATNVWQQQGLLWFLGSMALFLLIIGGLRYLGAKLLPAVLTAYAVLSLPLLDSAMYLGAFSGTEIAVAMALVGMVLALAGALAYGEWRLFLLTLLMGGLVFILTQRLLLVVGLGFAMFLARAFGSLLVTLLLTALALGLIFLTPWLPDSMLYWMSNVITDSSTSLEGRNSLAQLLAQAWIIPDNWHYLLLAGLGTIILWVFSEKNRGLTAYGPLVVAATAGILLTVVKVFYSADILSNEYLNQQLLLVAPLIALIPVSVYHLITKDNETLPTI